MAMTPDGRYLYVGGSGTSGPGEVTAHAVAANGTLTPVAGSPFTSPSPRGLVLSADGQFLYVANTGAEADHLLGVSTDVAERCELHLSGTSGNVMTMQMVDKVEVPAGGSASFAPMGAHVMLMGLKAPLKKGTSFPAILHFEKAGDVSVEVTVQGIADLQPMD